MRTDPGVSKPPSRCSGLSATGRNQAPHDHDDDHNTALAICKKCGDTEELKSNLFTEILKKKSLKNYDLNNFSMQIITTCKGCN